jgi:hypothetical protein
LLKDSGDDRAEVSPFDGSNVLSIDCVPTDASIYVLMDSGDDRNGISQYDHSSVWIIDCVPIYASIYVLTDSGANRLKILREELSNDDYSLTHGQ